jgi:hypothetical protein
MLNNCVFPLILVKFAREVIIMKSFTRCAIYLFSAVIITAGASCGKKWKKPATVSYQFRLNENSSSGLINFTSASVRVRELKFIGDRKQGQKHIEMGQVFDPLLFVPLSLTSTSTNINFDIPQGTYTKISMQMTIEGQQGAAPSLVIEGYYIYANHSIPVKFEYFPGETFEIPASSATGEKDIVLVEEQPASAAVLLNPSHWFANVTESMLNDADISVIGSDSVIVINPSNNGNIYQMVVDRLEDENTVVF